MESLDYAVFYDQVYQADDDAKNFFYMGQAIVSIGLLVPSIIAQCPANKFNSPTI